MTSQKEFLWQKGTQSETVPAFTIHLEEGKAQYLKEQLVLKDGLIQEKRAFEGSPDLYVTAGFINCHMHWVMNGDTTSFGDMLEETVRDPEGKAEIAVAHARNTLKLGITFGWDKGPPGICALPVYGGMRKAERKRVAMTRFIQSPWAVMSPGCFGYPFGRVSGSEQEMDIILREIMASGSGTVKFIPESPLILQNRSYRPVMPQELFQYARKKSKEKKILFAVHAKGTELLDLCIDAEVDCIEHGTQATARQMKAFQEKNIYLGPTLYGLECRLRWAQEAKTRLEIAAYEWNRACHMVARAAGLNRGAPFTHLLFSSDAGSFNTPHASLRELYLLRKCGFDTASVFQAATVNGARCTKQGQMGKVKNNHLANLVYWTQNPLELPLEEWEHLEEHIAAVVLEGTVVHRY